MQTRPWAKWLAPATMSLAVVAGTVTVDAQRGAVPPAIPIAAQNKAALDLTGYWVSVVSEDWRWRMLTPPKGDYSSVPLSAEGRRAALAWDWQKDIDAGNQCRPFGVGGIMRMPGRLHITWQDPNTLKIETDAGTQTRLLHFDKGRKPSGEKTWQGFSQAEWTYDRLVGQGPGQEPNPGTRGSMKVVTTHMKAGYTRKNGVPYSEDALVTEYFDRHTTTADGAEWFNVMTVVEDPTNYTQPFVTISIFKKERDNSKWHPTACEIAPPSIAVAPADAR